MGILTFLLVTLAGATADDLSAELPRIAPREPADALETFNLHDGFRLIQVAAEPLVTSPVDACYDEDGRLYVVEMRGYPYPEDSPTGRVVRLEDVDGDGRFDRSTVFLDDLNWPTGVVCSNGGVFVAAAPDLIYGKDTDGDGRADERRVAFTGFGKDNVQALFNGLIWGPDGWIHGNGSSNGGSIKNMARPDDPPIELGRRDFRFRPDGTAFEAISGGGQFGHTFDDWGHRFTCSNSNHLRQIVLPSWYLARNPDFAPPSPVVDIPAEGPAAPVFRISEPEPWRIVRTRQRAADPEFRKKLPPTELVATGFFTSATGVTIYRGSAFPPEYRGNAFIGDVGGNLVHRKRLEPDGAIFKAVRADEGVEFLASTDNWFRPVNFENTPDGTLLIIDMYRETIEHPWSIPEPIKQHLDLTSGKDRGRLYNLVPDGFKARPRPALSQATTPELVALLADPDAWWRETAQRLLIERNDPAAVPYLEKLAADRPSALGRMHALWTLQALGALSVPSLLAALADDDPRVREGAAVLAESHVDRPEVTRALARLAFDDDPMTRFQADFSVGQIADRRAALDALTALAYADPGSPWHRAALLSSLHGRAADLIGMLGHNREYATSDAGRRMVVDLAGLIGASGDSRSVAEVARLGKLEVPDARTAVRMVTTMLEGGRRTGRDLRAWMAEDSTPGHELRAMVEAQLAVLESAAASDERRLEAIQLVAHDPSGQSIPVLVDHLGVNRSSLVQLAALRALGAQNDPRIGPAIVGVWRMLAPNLRGEAAEVLLARPDRIARLVDAMEQGSINPAEIDPVRLAALAKHADPMLRDRSQKLLADRLARSDRRAVLDAYLPGLAAEGRVAEGRGVFNRVCATCHEAEGQGKAVGPAFATVAHRNPEDLLIHILDPNREVLPQYLGYVVATTDGRTLTGQVAEETPATITLKRAEGVTETIARDQIEEIASSGLSLMPEGLEKDIDPQAMADLIAFIRALKPPM